MQKLLRLLSDRTRLRILAAVEKEELAVNEIADILGMGQSRISNHLRLLKDAAALSGRREGAWTFYRNALPAHAQGAPLWNAVKRGLRDDQELKSDERRRRTILERRRRRSREHFAAGNGRNGAATLEKGCLREEILAALAPRSLVVVDAGCGDGYLTESLAARFDRVVAVDHSRQRLKAARKRVAADNVTFHHGEVDSLPLAANSTDAVFCSMVLHHVPEIQAVLAEARRVLRPGGRLVVADLAPHHDEAMRERMGDLRLGLEPEDLERALREAGFEAIASRPARDRLVTGRGPSLDLFIVTARRPAAERTKKAKRQGDQT